MNALLLAPLLAVALVAAAAAGSWLQRRRQLHLVGASALPGRPCDILYFTGQACTICRVAQRPALDRLVASEPGLVVREVDIAEEPALARRYRVMTLPSTIVFDAGGRVAAINAGFASEARLRVQARSAGAAAGERGRPDRAAEAQAATG